MKLFINSMGFLFTQVDNNTGVMIIGVEDVNFIGLSFDINQLLDEEFID